MKAKLHDDHGYKKWDDLIIREIYKRDTYKLKEIAKQKINLIFDIGAHIGLFTLYAHDFWPKAKIVSFEPFIDNFELLEQNAKFATTINMAVSDFNGQSKLLTYKHINSRNTGGSKLNNKVGDQVNVVNIATAISRFGVPDLLKLDCEGSEKEILLHLNKLNLLKRIRYIRGESHYPDNSWLHQIFQHTHKFVIKQGKELSIFTAEKV